jgi:hypothetical protein
MFFLLEGVGYGVWTVLAQGRLEWTGTIVLGLCFVFGGLLAFYLTVSSARPRALPEDDPSAGIEDADTEVGHFSPWSWWPFALATACFIGFFGLAIGVWMVLIGAAFATIAVVGWVYEYYRGFHAR